jgi:hypothetical protein
MACPNCGVDTSPLIPKPRMPLGSRIMLLSGIASMIMMVIGMFAFLNISNDAAEATIIADRLSLVSDPSLAIQDAVETAQALLERSLKMRNVILIITILGSTISSLVGLAVMRSVPTERR